MIVRRLGEAADDMAHWREFDYVVVNDVFDRALDELSAIVQGRDPPEARRDRAGLGELAAGLVADRPLS